MKRILAAAALCAMPLLSMAQSPPSPSTMVGYISDSRCPAGPVSEKPDDSCIQRHHSKPVLIVSKSETWIVDNPRSVKKANYGKKFSVEATVTDSTRKLIHIIHLTPTQQPMPE